MPMDEFSVDNYLKNLGRVRKATPDEYEQWLQHARNVVRSQFDELSPEAKATLSVQIAGQMALYFIGEKIDLSLGLIQDACEQIGNR